MKFLTIVRPGPAPPPPDLARAAQQWLHEKLDDGTFESVYAFVEGGGFSVGNADSVEGQMELMLEYPIAPFVQYEVHPLVELDDAFERLMSMLERVAGQGYRREYRRESAM
jgi:hypothetical protein